jgi:hypothetical protein
MSTPPAATSQTSLPFQTGRIRAVACWRSASWRARMRCSERAMSRRLDELRTERTRRVAFWAAFASGLALAIALAALVVVL